MLAPLGKQDQIRVFPLVDDLLVDDPRGFLHLGLDPLFLAALPNSRRMLSALASRAFSMTEKNSGPGERLAELQMSLRTGPWRTLMSMTWKPVRRR